MTLLNVAFTNFSSSSSESKDEEDMIFLSDEENEYRRKPRINNFIENIIYAYNSSCCTAIS